MQCIYWIVDMFKHFGRDHKVERIVFVWDLLNVCHLHCAMRIVLLRIPDLYRVQVYGMTFCIL